MTFRSLCSFLETELGLPVRESDRETELSTLGLDSVHHLQLVLLVDEVAPGAIGPDEWPTWRTLGDVYASLAPPSGG